jgi:hypothetical protein
MQVKDAVRQAKSYLSELLSDEGLTNLGLEEIEFDEANSVWNVTLGFSRPWNSTRGPLSTISGEPPARRAYRVLRVRDSDGEVVSVKKRDVLE